MYGCAFYGIQCIFMYYDVCNCISCILCSLVYFVYPGAHLSQAGSPYTCTTVRTPSQAGPPMRALQCAHFHCMIPLKAQYHERTTCCLATLLHSPNPAPRNEKWEMINEKWEMIYDIWELRNEKWGWEMRNEKWEWEMRNDKWEMRNDSDNGNGNGDGNEDENEHDNENENENEDENENKNK